MKQGQIWHQRLGHPGLKLLVKTSKITEGMPNLQGLTEADISCEACTKAKMVRRPSKGPLADPLLALDSIEGDTFELKPRAHDKTSVVLLFIDRKTRFRWAFLLENKAGPTVFNAVKNFFKSLRNQYNRYPKRLFFDGGKEINSDLENWLSAKGINFITSSPYVHEQNGLIERSVRVLIERLRATIIGARLPQYLWCYILPAVLELINNTAVTNKEHTPSQALLDNLNPGQNNVPNLGRYKIIGAPCDVLIPPEKRLKAHKLASKTEPGRLLAVLSLKTFLVWIPARKIVVKTPFIKLKEGALLKGKATISKDSLLGEGEIIGLATEENHNSGGNSLGKSAAPEKPNISPDTSHSHGANNSEVNFWDSKFAKKIANLIPKAPEKQHKSISTSLNWLWPEQLNSSEPAKCHFLAEEAKNAEKESKAVEIANLIQNISYKATKKQAKRPVRKKGRYNEPQSLAEALKSPLSGQWLKAIYDELTQLLEFGTFKFLPKDQLPKGRKPLNSRVVYRQKVDKEGNITKFKARLVVKGFMQIEGVDYLETFASTTIPPTWRILLALAAINNWEIEQIDFIGAFLNGDLSEDIYMEIPPELVKLAAENDKFAKLATKFGYNSSENQIIRLQKALYGLKQSPRVWQNHLKDLLKDLGYEPLASDSAVYINPKERLFVITFVDDCIIIGPDINKIKALKTKLGVKYAIEDRGPASYFLGVEILRDRPNRMLYLSQRNYISEVLKHFEFNGVRTIKSPLQPGLIKDVNSEFTALKGTPVGKSDLKLYQQIIGCCMYAMTQTRPDIAFAVQFLSRSLQEPLSCHINAAKNLLRYLNGTKNLAICYGMPCSQALTEVLKDSHYNPLLPLGFSDSDFASDKITSKSTYGYLFTVAGGPVSWKSKRSSTIALSTMEAESDALTEAIREVQWLRNLYSELNRPIQTPTLVLEDNQSTIKAAKDPALHSRTKHTLLKYRYIREARQAGVFDILYIDTKRMPADGLTKPLGGEAHRNFINLIGLTAI